MSDDATADRVVIDFRVSRDGDYEEWVRRSLTTDEYLAYLRRTRRGPVEPGDEWEEFVSRGCGLPLDVTLRVEAVEGGTEVGEETRVVVVAPS